MAKATAPVGWLSGVGGTTNRACQHEDTLADPTYHHEIAQAGNWRSVLAVPMLRAGAPIGASEAERIGLVNRVVPAAELMTEARKLAGQLATRAPIAMRYIINAVNKGMEIPFAEACQYEATLFGLVASTDDMKEGTTAFLTKRKPEFKGR